ncbi:MAG: hypothetical protein HWE27_14085 [Gammaproteobacteria bacterium]|nr:hypothetical protein [Gammaproteobacteria bacterium]
MTIHTGRGERYIADGVLEETFIHEGAHISFDRYHDNNSNWRQAQNRDGVSISDYGQEFPVREDLAETLGPYLALRFRRDRIGESLAQTVLGTIPNRVRYLDGLNLSMKILGDDDSNSGEISPRPGSRLAPVTTFRWPRADNATDFDLLVGTTGAGSRNIRGSSVFNQNFLEVRNLPTNVPVYVRLWVWNGRWSSTDYVYNTDAANACSVNSGDAICPKPGATLNSTTTFSWARKPNVTDFDLIIGSNGAGSNNIRASSVFNNTSYTARNLPSNRTIYVRLWEWNGSWSYTDFSYNSN